MTMDIAQMIKYALALARISDLHIAFDPAQRRVIIHYEDRTGPQETIMTFAEIEDMLNRPITSQAEAPGGPPAGDRP